MTADLQFPGGILLALCQRKLPEYPDQSNTSAHTKNLSNAAGKTNAAIPTMVNQNCLSKLDSTEHKWIA